MIYYWLINKSKDERHRIAENDCDNLVYYLLRLLREDTWDLEDDIDFVIELNDTFAEYTEI